MTVHGVFPHGDPCDCTALHAVSLDVDHRPFHEATFQAWSFRRADVLSVSRTVAFTVPIGADSGLPLVVRTQETPSSSPSVFPLRLSPGREPGLARLVCGHFAIALPGERPVWENCELRALLADDERGESTGGPRTLCRRGEAAEVPVPFGYFLITVEHAGA